MLFSSIPFLYYFLPLTLLCYFLAPRCAKNAVLLLFSLVFYAWGEPKYVLFMVASILQGYLFGRLVEKYRNYPRRSKLFLTVSVLFSLLLLGYCKYADFFIRSFNAVTGLSVPLLRVALPIGISFYTFQILSYVVDVYRGTVAAQRNLIDLGTYIAMFPQLIAGPIVRYADIEPQLKERRSTPDMIAAGAQRFVLGLAKKVLIANVLYQLITVYKSTTQPSVLYSWMYAAAYMLHIYFDFSGYSDMAVGLGLLFGIRLPENFRYPYCADSVTDFWRRWHISLSAWFRDYLYIPLGGNRRGILRTMANKLLVFLATGLWHGTGWTFVLWGLWHGLLSCMETALQLPGKLKNRWYGHVYALFAVILGFAVFRAADVSQAGALLGAMLTGFSPDVVCRAALLAALSRRTLLLCVLALALCLPLWPWLQKKIEPLRIWNALRGCLMLLLFVLCLLALASGSFQPFIYASF